MLKKKSSGAAAIVPLGRQLILDGESLRTLAESNNLEWLVTNGIGGYASGALSGTNTRRYHGLLMAALDPPLGRTLLAAKVGETVTIAGASTPLSSNEWWDESISPRGFENLAAFWLEDGLPVFSFQVSGHELQKRVWMEDGENLTWTTYTWPLDAPPAQLSLKLFLAHRDYHSTQRGSSDSRWRSGTAANTVWVAPGDGALHSVFKVSSLDNFVSENAWYWGFLHCVERERGLDDTEDYWMPGTFEITLLPGQTVALLVSAGDTPRDALDWEAALQRERERRASILRAAPAVISGDIESTLVAAADAFLVRRPVVSQKLPNRPNTIVAGYHWFGDWGRDTMIALPGLCLATGRAAEARDILHSYSAFVSQGMLPNRFPDSGAAPEYNTVDATLHYFGAIYRYLAATGDNSLLHDLYSCLVDIIEWHFKGTRHGIGMDPADGLLRAGEGGVQLTWMDAKVGDWVVTPRTGKPVEIQALWYNALEYMALWAPLCGADGSRYAAAASLALNSFGKRFPIPGAPHLYDVVDSPGGDDAALRPNQLFAASLPYPLLPVEQARAMVEACEKHLLTPCGLRSLSPEDSRYVGFYGGDQWHRDGSYHQGTVWAWLIGPYVDAILYAFADQERASTALRPLLDQVLHAGIGTVSEIFDGDAPHRPRGCIAQAWSVGEILRLLQRLGTAAAGVGS